MPGRERGESPLAIPGRWDLWAEDFTAGTKRAGRWRTLREFDARGQSGVLGGREVVAFASNDYLGLSHHPLVLDGARTALRRWGAGSGASRLVTGTRPVHAELEAALAEWKGTETALVFPTGFAANLGVLTALGGPGVTVFSDALNHASIVDGCRLARSEVAVFGHRDADHLESLLASSHARRALIASDAVFSMDGDGADVDRLVDIAERYDALLLLDEAHSVFGPPSAALSSAAGAGRVIRIGTLSKALGSLGGFVACTGRMAEVIVNTARPFIFTTALSPPDCGAALAALRVLHSPEGDSLRRTLAAHVELIAPGHRSAIVPVVVGAEDLAVAASGRLLERGFLVPAIRPPSVPPGTSRLRVTLSTDHTSDQVRALAAALAEEGLWPSGNRPGETNTSVPPR